MNILIDADGCPVVDLTLQIAKQVGIPVIILCDTSHQIECEGAQTLVFDKGADSVLQAVLIQHSGTPGKAHTRQPVVLCHDNVTRLYPVDQRKEYTADNMDALMLRRYENKKLLRAGKHPKGSAKRTKEQDVKFTDTLTKILNGKH